MGISGRLAAGAFALTALFACSSSSTVNSGGTPQDKGVDPGTGQTQQPGAGSETNPYGVAYPTTNIGYKARNGSNAGNIIKNYKFLGYRNGDPSKLETISLADYFDPQTKHVRLEVRHGGAPLSRGTTGGKFARCIVCDPDRPIKLGYVRAEGRAGRIGHQLVALVTRCGRARGYGVYDGS